MAMFLIELSHTKEGCARALDEIMGYNPDLLSQLFFGCTTHVHRAWGTLDARSESAVRDMIAPSMRETAQVIPVEQFTAEQIKALYVEV